MFRTVSYVLCDCLGNMFVVFTDSFETVFDFVLKCCSEVVMTFCHSKRWFGAVTKLFGWFRRQLNCPETYFEACLSFVETCLIDV